VSGSAATSDLVKLAFVALQTGAARNAQQSVKRLVRLASLQAAAALCVVAALGCAMGALWACVAPILGAAGALLAGAGVFGVIALAAYILAWRTEKMRPRSPAPGAEGEATLAAAASLFKQHAGLALVAALLAGVFVGSER
jgi:hypothetical protein